MIRRAFLKSMFSASLACMSPAMGRANTMRKTEGVWLEIVDDPWNLVSHPLHREAMKPTTMLTLPRSWRMQALIKYAGLREEGKKV